MNEAMEKVLSLLKALSAIGVLLGAIIAGFTSHTATISPLVNSSLENFNYQWFHSDVNTTCSFSTLWRLKNNGSADVTVEDISYTLYAVPDMVEDPEKGMVIDRSAGNRIEKSKALFLPQKIYPSKGNVGIGESITRDIQFDYKPNSTDPKDWFDSNKLMLRIVSKVKVSAISEPCIFCRKGNSINITDTRIQYTCKPAPTID